jgi:putative oxidoreductase
MRPWLRKRPGIHRDRHLIHREGSEGTQGKDASGPALAFDSFAAKNLFSQEKIVNQSSTTADWGALLLRLALGTMWISHALLKVLVFTLPGAAQFFDSVGLPGVLVYPVVAAELLGGTAILLGLQGRYASALLIPILLVAAWVHWPNGWVFTSAGGGWEYPVLLAAVSAVHVLIGDGAYAWRPSWAAGVPHGSVTAR